MNTVANIIGNTKINFRIFVNSIYYFARGIIRYFRYILIAGYAHYTCILICDVGITVKLNNLNNIPVVLELYNDYACIQKIHIRLLTCTRRNNSKVSRILGKRKNSTCFVTLWFLPRDPDKGSVYLLVYLPLCSLLLNYILRLHLFRSIRILLSICLFK